LSGRLEVVRLEVGELLSNCYILVDRESLLLAVIDPGAEGKKIAKELERLGGEVAYIINTHGHFDHIGANNELKEAFPEALLCVGRLDEKLLQDENLNLSAFFGTPFRSIKADRLLDDGEILEFLDIRRVGCLCCARIWSFAGIHCLQAV